MNNNVTDRRNLGAGGVDSVEISVSIAESRKTLEWQNVRVTWGQLAQRLSAPTVTPESWDEFLALPHDVQGDIKDVGGWVGGVVQGGRRIRGSVPYRQVLALDLDSTTLKAEEMWYKLNEVWDFKFLIHTTRSYTDLTPRYRCVIPLSRLVDALEYEAVGRYIASLHDINEFDPSTYQSTRLMYFPSTSKDGYFWANESGGGLANVDAILATYSDYADPTQWAYAHNDSPQTHRELEKAQDPLLKGGVVGAFCRAYSIRQVLEGLLGSYYRRESNGRYTYIGGSTSGGVVVYDDRWCYSHHSTDPNRGKLLNAFDLYRLVKFGAMDFGKSHNTKVDNLPSYAAMVELCNSDSKVQKYLIKDEISDLSLFQDQRKANGPDGKQQKQEQQQEDSAGAPEWLIDLHTKLDKNAKTGAIESTLSNFATILEFDPNIIKNLMLDDFSHQINVLGKLPWERGSDKWWGDSDDASARIYIDKVYRIKPNKGFYDDAFSHVISKAENRCDSALDFINRGRWDGVARAEELMITAMGVDDTELNRMQTLVWLKAVVARQLNPGIKFDNMLVLSGVEAIGKSTLFRLLVGDDFFTDCFSFSWKDEKQVENITGKMIVESAELDGFDKKETEAVKAFLSRSVDRYRKPYGRHVTNIPRRCVFAGTTNQVEVLRSQTGNRRMWIMQCHKNQIKVPSWDLLTPSYVEQLWAEVREKYKEDRRLYLPSHLMEQQRQQQREFTQEDPLANEVLQYVKIWLPMHWEEMSAHERYIYINEIKRGQPARYTPSKRRETVSSTEFINEWMGERVDNKTLYLSKQINTVIRTLEGFNDIGRIRDNAYSRLISFSIDKEVNGKRYGAIDDNVYSPNYSY